MSHPATQGESVTIPGTGFYSPGFQTPILVKKPSPLHTGNRTSHLGLRGLSLHCLGLGGLSDTAGDAAGQQDDQVSNPTRAWALETESWGLKATTHTLAG